MKTLTVANQKGGVGKTALVINLAWNASEQGKKVAVIDLDVQGNCSFTLEQHKCKITTADILLGKVSTWSFDKTYNKEGITLFTGDNRLQSVETRNPNEIAEHLRQGIAAIAPDFDLCLIDSPAAFCVRFMAGLLAADYVLAPFELEAYSIQGIKKLVATFGNARKHNAKLKFLGILANKVDNRNPRQREHLAQLQEHYANILVPETIGLRTSIAESLVRGEPVWTNKKTAARTATREVRGAAKYVFEKMGL